MSNDKNEATFHGGEYVPIPDGQTVQTTKPKKKKRVFMWFFLVVQLVFIIWLVAGISSTGSTPADTGGVLTQEEANSARDAGAAIGVFLIFVVWAIVDFILGVGYLIVKMARR